jgi:hypothetical protein
MAEQEDQKGQEDSIARQDQPVSATSSQTNTTRTAIESHLETISAEEDAQEKSEQPSALEIRRRQLLIGGLGAAATLASIGLWLWIETPHENSGQHTYPGGNGDQLVLQWNEATLQAIRETQPAIPVAARALAIVHTCMFDAWAAYDATASGTQFGTRLRRPEQEQTLANKSQALSFAAFRALVDLFPARKASFSQIMTSLGYDATNLTMNSDTPVGIGNLTAQAVQAFRHRDEANQLGDLHHTAYSDYTRYQALNTPDAIKDPNHWQPLDVPNSHASFATQKFAGAQWANVIPFALSSSTQFLPRPGPALYPAPLYAQQAQEILQYSADLTDEKKVIAEYWTNGPNKEQPAGHWCLLAQFISQRNSYSLDQNVKMFFALTNALLDTSIAVWATKRAYDSPYPLTAIHYLFHDKQVKAWVGPGRGIQWIDGAYWQPYQPENRLAPPYPEYCSEHSAFSAVAASILRNFTGSDQFGMSSTIPAHSSLIEPDIPADDVTLSWETFSHAADQAGLSQRYSGTHFTQSDLAGRILGSQVGQQVWQKARHNFNGS